MCMLTRWSWSWRATCTWERWWPCWTRWSRSLRKPRRSRKRLSWSPSRPLSGVCLTACPSLPAALADSRCHLQLYEPMSTPLCHKYHNTNVKNEKQKCCHNLNVPWFGKIADGVVSFALKQLNFDEQLLVVQLFELLEKLRSCLLLVVWHV